MASLIILQNFFKDRNFWDVKTEPFYLNLLFFTDVEDEEAVEDVIELPAVVIEDSDIEEDNVNQEEIILQQIQNNVQRRQLIELMNQEQTEDQIQVLGVSKNYKEIKLWAYRENILMNYAII